jgi:hypothetical protein
MKQIRRHIAALSCAAAIVVAGAAHATQQGQDVIKRWNAMDKCARAAQLAFPDFTPEANAKRDRKLQDCLNSGNLPPRQPDPSGR